MKLRDILKQVKNTKIEIYRKNEMHPEEGSMARNEYTIDDGKKIFKVFIFKENNGEVSLTITYGGGENVNQHLKEEELQPENKIINDLIKEIIDGYKVN